MKLNTKVPLIMLSVVSVLILGYYLVFRFIVYDSFLELDNRLALRNVNRVAHAIDRELKHLDSFTHDWSSWDDTYRFALDGNKQYQDSNLLPAVFRDQKLNLIHVYNKDGRLVWGRTYDMDFETELDLDLREELGAEVFREMTDQQDKDRSTRGFILTGSGILVISSNPILTSQNTGPSRGAMVMGRFIGKEFIETIAEQTAIDIAAFSLNDAKLPREARQFMESHNGDPRDTHLYSTSRKTHAYFMIRDIAGHPVLMIRASMPRDIMMKGTWAYTIGFLFIITLGIIILLVLSVLLSAMVIRPITSLTSEVLRWEGTEDVSGQFFMARRDEIGTLSREFKTLVEKLSERQKSIEFSEKRLRQIIDLVPHYIFAKDLDGSFVLANKAFADLFGLQPGDMVGMNICSLVSSEETIRAIRDEDSEVIRTGKPRHVARDILFSAARSNRYVQTTQIPFMSPDASKPAVLGVSVDMTEIKNAEEALRQSQRMMEDLINFLPDATFAVDRNGKLIAWNRAMEVMTGLSMHDLNSSDPEEYTKIFYGETRPVLLDLIFEDNEGVRAMFDFVIGKGDTYISESYAPNLYQGRGAHIWAIAAPFYDSSGSIVGAVECIRDITDRKKAEELLRRHSETIEQLLDGVVMTGLDGTIHYANPSWANMHGYTADEIVQRHIEMFHTKEQMMSEVTPFVEELLANGSNRGNLGRIKKDGTLFTTLTSSFLLKDAHGKPTAIIKIARDITDELKMENQLRQAQKMEVVGRLAGGVAHDLNNMLSPILGYAEIVLTEMSQQDPGYDHIVQIKTAADRARNLTHELLAFSRKQVLDMKIVDLAEVVASYGKMLRRTIREDIAIHIRQNLSKGAVRVDISQMGQILMNLAVNAADAMPQGGSITIDIRDVTLDDAYAQTHQGVVAGNYVVMSFSDTGLGINPKIMEHIFEPFFTTKERGKGTGLGLATVYGIVRQHGGHISVYSEIGMGTTFKIYLPCVDGIAENLLEPSPATRGVGGKETIAVAEDDPGVRELTCEILKKHGYNVITAASSHELLAFLEASDDPIDMLLTDVIMPDMNGRELYLKLSERRPDLKVLFMSGYTDDVIAHHGILEKGVQLIQKPFSIGTLTEKIRHIIDA